MSSLLEELALRCNQAGSMNWLSHTLSAPSFKGKTIYLVLLVAPGTSAKSLTGDDIHAAVLLFEYRILGLPTRTFCSDWAGFRTVVAPEPDRAGVAAITADALLCRGATMVLISYRHPEGASRRIAPKWCDQVDWGWLTRPAAMTLPLEKTWEATLAKLGKSTRNNLKYYRRRLAKEMPCAFVPDARGMLRDDELKALNAGSLNPVPGNVFRLQYESSCHLPGGFLLGLRNRQGQWISLVGGWRQAGVTVHYWQMNTAGHEKLSIAKAMLAHFLEYEVSLGTRALSYNGGTPNPIRYSFTPEEATYLIARHRSWQAVALYKLFQLFGSVRFMQVNSLLAQIINRDDIVWHSTEKNVVAAKSGSTRPEVL